MVRWRYARPPTHGTLCRHRSFEAVLDGRPHRIADRGPKFVLIKIRGGSGTPTELGVHLMRRVATGA